MALINLPGHTPQNPIQWDDNLSLDEQTEAARSYAYGIQESYPISGEITENCKGGTATRVCCYKHVDTVNNFELVVKIKHKYSAEHDLYNVINSFTHTMVEL